MNTVTCAGQLQLCPAVLGEDYRKKWNIRERDFVCLYKDGAPVSSSLYRVGGMGNSNPGEGRYFMLLKYVEAYYPENIMLMCDNKDPKHLSGRWCILDKNGVEKVVFEAHASPYFVKNSCIYHLNNNYYNIETGECYCQSYNNMESADFLFLNNAFDKDKSKRGVMQINKQDGSWTLFP